MILLFDVDGVLIDSRAYHAALQNTVAYFAKRLGLGEIELSKESIFVFESQSITVEWDSSAICIAALLLERLKAAPVKHLAPHWWEALDQLGAKHTQIAPFDFNALAQRVGEATPPGDLPSHTALALFSQDKLPPETRGLLVQLLANCYDIDAAPGMQLFQNYALGHAQYAQYYGLPSHVTCEPLLEKLDRPFLKPEMRDKLLERLRRGEISAAIYTARPSLAPLEAEGTQRGYTPEAEIGRAIVGLDPLPIMAFGKVEWIGRRVGRSGADLVKPSPVHAMAAMAAARTGLEVEALKAALAVEHGDHLRYPLTACAGETVHVFEDSASSLRAVTRAVELLNRQGLGLSLVRHGIAPAKSPKRATLKAIADVVHKDVNEALATIL